MAKRTYVWNGSAWVENAPVATFNAATTSTQGIVQLTDSTSSTSTTTAATPNSVKTTYDLASGKAAKAGDTFTGSVTAPQVTLTGGDSTTGTDTASLNLVGGNSRGGAGYHGFLDVKNTSAGATNPKKFLRLNSTGGLEIVNNAYNKVIFAVSDTGVITSTQAGTYDLFEGIILQRTTSLSIATTTLSTTPTTANTTAITWSSAVKANTAMWSSGSAITAPLAGYYQINLGFQFGTGASYACAGYIFQGSTLRAHEEKQAGANTAADMLNVSTMIYCAANDSITARVAASTTSKSIIVTSQNGYFSMLYLGETA